MSPSVSIQLWKVHLSVWILVVDKILVTGTSGYIGSHFVSYIRGSKRVVRFSLRQQNLEDISFEGVTAVVHCAGVAHKKKGVSPDIYNRVNNEYALDLARRAKQKGVPHFIFLSSVSVYGQQNMVDEHSECLPTTEYAKSKLNAEKGLLALVSEGFTLSVLRIPMIYGPNAPGNVSRLCNLIKRFCVLPFKNIQNRRSFLGIENLVFSIDQILERKVPGILLLADDKPVSTSRMVELLINGYGRPRILLNADLIEPLVRRITPRVHESLWGNFVINCDETKELLQLTMPFSPEEGVPKVMAAF